MFSSRLLTFGIPLFLALFGFAGWRIAVELDPGRTPPFADGPSFAVRFVAADAGLTLADILAEPDAFHAADPERYTHGSLGETLWLRLQLSNTDEQPLAGALRLSEPYNDEVTLFEPDGTGGWLERQQGERVPASRAATRGNECTFPITLPAHAITTCYMVVRDAQFPDVRLRWHEPAGYLQRVAVAAARDGFYFGLLASLCAYNLFLYVRTRQSDRLWYCVYLVAFGSWFFVALNRTLSFGLPLASPWREAIMLALLFAAAGTVAKLTRVSLNLGEHAKRWDRFLRLVEFITFALGVTALIAPTITLNQRVFASGLLLGHFLGLTSLGGAIVAWRKGVPTARYFVLAFACLFVGVGIGIAIELAQLHLNDTRTFLTQLGSTAEMLILGFAVADRFRRLQDAHTEAQQLALREARRREEEQSRHAAELAARAVELARLSAHKDSILRLLGYASHDLKGPLAALNAAARTVENLADRPAEVRTLAVTMQSETEHMTRLVHDFLDRAALDGDSLSLNLAPLDLVAVVSRVVASHRRLAEQKQQSLTLDKPAAALPHVAGEASRLEQVFANLIGNAIKYTPPGGAIRVEFGHDSNNVWCEIHDSGPGIAPEEFGRLFQPFSRLSAQPTGGEASSGLGLYLTRELVALHHGALSVDSQPGRGSAFRVTLPTPA